LDKFLLRPCARIKFTFRFEGKDFRDDETGWEETVNFYRNSHRVKKQRNAIPFPKCLESTKVTDVGKEELIDYIIGPMADVRKVKGKQNIKNLKKLQLCVKSIALETQFQFLSKIIFCKVRVRIIELLKKSQYLALFKYF
jgi:hypothetical protein